MKYSVAHSVVHKFLEPAQTDHFRVKEKYGVERREGRERGGEEEYLVRGRVFQTHKPVTFNQPWSRYNA